MGRMLKFACLHKMRDCERRLSVNANPHKYGVSCASCTKLPLSLSCASPCRTFEHSWSLGTKDSRRCSQISGRSLREIRGVTSPHSLLPYPVDVPQVPMSTRVLAICLVTQYFSHHNKEVEQSIRFSASGFRSQHFTDISSPCFDKLLYLVVAEWHCARHSSKVRTQLTERDCILERACLDGLHQVRCAYRHLRFQRWSKPLVDPIEYQGCRRATFENGILQ